MAEAPRDENRIPTLLGVSSSDGITPIPLQANPATGRLLVDLAGGGSGDVVGPASATDNAVARFDTTTGKLIQNSVVLIGDTGAITRAIILSMDGSTSGSTVLQPTAVASGTLTLPAATDTLVGRNTTDTLTNKTLTSPTIGNFTNAAHDHTNAAGGSQLNITGATTGTLTVSRGGTGATTLTNGGILLGSGTGAITALGVATNGQIPIGDGTGDPVLATITGTTNEINVTNGAGSITLDLPSTVRITGDILDTFNNEQIRFLTAISAVNEITVNNAATGNAPSISASGSDTNVDLELSGKGTGIVKGELKRFMVQLLDSGADQAVATTIQGDFRISNRAITIQAVGAYVDTAGTTGTSTIDINEGGTTILSTKITIDSGEKSSETAATAPVISDTAIAADAIITFDIDAIQTTPAKGLKVWIDYVYA